MSFDSNASVCFKLCVRDELTNEWREASYGIVWFLVNSKITRAIQDTLEELTEVMMGCEKCKTSQLVKVSISSRGGRERRSRNCSSLNSCFDAKLIA